MIMIDSKTGQRLARARAALKKAQAEHEEKMGPASSKFVEAQKDFHMAACELANELIAQGHHAAEDYS